MEIVGLSEEKVKKISNDENLKKLIHIIIIQLMKKSKIYFQNPNFSCFYVWQAVKVLPVIGYWVSTSPITSVALKMNTTAIENDSKYKQH